MVYHSNLNKIICNFLTDVVAVEAALPDPVVGVLLESKCLLPNDGPDLLLRNVRQPIPNPVWGVVGVLPGGEEVLPHNLKSSQSSYR